MPDDMNKTTKITRGDGWATGPLDAMGDGYGFRKIRRELDVKAFGVNAIVIPPGFDTGSHFHDVQEELYFVHRGTIEMTFGDGTTQLLTEGSLARVDAPTPRSVRNPGDTDAVYVVIGGHEGYVGRDGRAPEATAGAHTI
jgi:quercetin dioxygenase-like cupin family protein